MTDSTQTEPQLTKRKRARRKKQRSDAAGSGSRDAEPQRGDAKPAAAGLGRALALLAAAVAAALFYVLVAPNDGNRPYALLAVGGFAFLFGASPGLNPEKTVAALAAIVATGLAVIGMRASEIGTVLAMGGGLGLGGGIHRLGRLGPDEGIRLPRTKR